MNSVLLVHLSESVTHSDGSNGSHAQQGKLTFISANS